MPMHIIIHNLLYVALESTEMEITLFVNLLISSDSRHKKLLESLTIPLITESLWSQAQTLILSR